MTLRRVSALRYETLSVLADGKRHMEFYSTPRVDGLLQRTEAPGEMTETFKDRDDFLYYRHVVFSRRIQFVDSEETLDPDLRPLDVKTHSHTYTDTTTLLYFLFIGFPILKQK